MPLNGSDQEKEQQTEEENKREWLKERFDDVNAYYLEKYFNEQVVMRKLWDERISFGIAEKFRPAPPVDPAVPTVSVDDRELIKGNPPEHGWHPVFFGEEGKEKQADFHIYYDDKGARPIPPSSQGWAAAVAFLARETLADTMVISVSATPYDPIKQADFLKKTLKACIAQGVAGQLSPSANEMLGNPAISSSRRMEILNLERLSRLGLAETTMNRANLWMEDEQKASAERTAKLDASWADAKQSVNGSGDKIVKLNADVKTAEQKLKDIETAGVKETKDWKDAKQALVDLEAIASPDTLAAAQKQLEDIEKADIKETEAWKDAKQDVDNKELAVKRENVDQGAAMGDAISNMMKELDASISKIEQTQGHLDEVAEAEKQVLESAENVVWLNEKKTPTNVSWRKFKNMFSTDHSKSVVESEIKNVDDVIKMVDDANLGDKNTNKENTFKSLVNEQQKLSEIKKEISDAIKKLPANVPPEKISELNKKMVEYDAALGKLGKKSVELKNWHEEGRKAARDAATAPLPPGQERRRGFGL